MVFVLYGSARGTGRKYHGKTFAIKSEDADVSLYEKSSAASANCQIFVIELKIPFSFHSDQQNPHEQ